MPSKFWGGCAFQFNILYPDIQGAKIFSRTFFPEAIGGGNLLNQGSVSVKKTLDPGNR